MISEKYHKATLFCLTASILILSINYLIDFDKVHIIYALASSIRAIIAISIFVISCHLFLVPKQAPATFALDWLLRSALCLVCMFVCAALIIMPGLFISFVLLSGFLSLVEFIFSIESIPRHYQNMIAEQIALPLIAGIGGGFCLWKLMQRTYSMRKPVSDIWLRYIVSVSCISMLIYFNVAYLLPTACNKNVCGFEREITALTFLISAAIFFFGCFRAWHLTEKQIIEGLYREPASKF